MNEILFPIASLINCRLPHAPVPSRPDYSRSLDYDDFRALKKPAKPVDTHKVEHWDMSFWVREFPLHSRINHGFIR